MRAADRLLLDATRRAGGWAFLLAGAELVGATAQVLLPLSIGRAVDAALHSGFGGWAVGCAVLLAALVAGNALADFGAGRVAARSTAWLRHRLVRHVFAVGVPAGRRFGTGDLVSRLVGGAAAIGDGATALVSCVVVGLPTVGSVLILCLLNLWLGIAFLAGLPVLTLVLRVFVRDTASVVTGYQRVQGRIATLLTEAVAGARTIAAAGTVDTETDRVLRPVRELHAFGRDMWRAQARAAASGALLLPLLEAVVLAVAGVELVAGRLSVGSFLAAARYVSLGAGIGAVVGTAGQFARARAGARRIEEVLAQQPIRYGTRTPADGDGTVEFRGVTVSGVLRSVDLTVPGGRSLALVGRSGAGKSVLAGLAGRLTEPDAGTVLLDGVPLVEWDRAALRAAVGYAFERPALLGDTVADAIGFGPETLAIQRIVAAAAAADAAGFVCRLPAGYATRLAEAPLSGGETQRLGLARAFAHQGRLLVLDDATASLDMATELRISTAITERLAGRTRLLVTHRVSTAARADLVAWLDEGVLRAVGPHRELWRDPAYRALFEVNA